MELQKQADRLKIVGAKSRYQKGREPESKGKPMPKHVYDRIKESMFKKGHFPHNTKKVGYEVLRRDKNGNYYWFIKVEGKRKLEPKHVHLWVSVHDKVPASYNIVFKDGNTQNCIIENLECISDAELMLRNSKANYPTEIIPTMIILKKLTKKIHEKQTG